MLNEIHMSDIYRNSKIETTKMSLNYNEFTKGELTAQFVLNNFTRIDIQFKNIGMAYSIMEVKICENNMSFNNIQKYQYHFDSNTFIKYIKIFMLKQIKAWDERYCFNEIECILDFYNDVLKNGTLKE